MDYEGPKGPNSHGPKDHAQSGPKDRDSLDYEGPKGPNSHGPKDHAQSGPKDRDAKLVDPNFKLLWKLNLVRASPSRGSIFIVTP